MFTYARTYDAQKLRTLIEDFSTPLESHMNEEIDSLLSLEKYGSENLVKAFANFESKLVAEADKVASPLSDLVPEVPEDARQIELTSLVSFLPNNPWVSRCNL